MSLNIILKNQGILKNKFVQYVVVYFANNMHNVFNTNKSFMIIIPHTNIGFWKIKQEYILRRSIASLARAYKPSGYFWYDVHLRLYINLYINTN